MPYTLFQGGRRRRRRRAPAILAVLLLIAAAAAAVALALQQRGGDDGGSAEKAPARERAAGDGRLEPLAGGGTAPAPLAVRLEDGGDPVRARFKHMPRSGLLFDADTGRVLWRHKPARVLPIASLTKMMTALLVADRLGPRARVPITRQALRYRGSGVGLLPRGKRIRTETLLYGLMLPSGNDAAIAIARHLAGSEEQFIDWMNARVQTMGLRNTHFKNPHGLDEDGHYSSAYDMVMLAREGMRDPFFRQLAAAPDWRATGALRNYRMENLNRLIGQYPGADGVKIGYLGPANRTSVVSATRDGHRVYAAVMRSRDLVGDGSALLDYAFESYSWSR